MDPVTMVPHGHEWTIDDLKSLPDNGLQHELFDGVLVVSAPPTPEHQRIVFGMARYLWAQCPPELEVLTSPDFRPSRRRSLQPDLMVTRRNVLGDTVRTVPLLAVEVLSEGTRSKDLIFKHEMYLSSRITSYWVIDPDAASFVAYELNGDTYRRRLQATGQQRVHVDRPFPIPICPAELLG